MLPLGHDADRAVISAINEGDVVALACALRRGGASPRTEALKLLLSALANRPGDSLHIRPKRGRGEKQNPLIGIDHSPWDLRRGISHRAREELIRLLELEVIWIGRRAAAARGPRADVFRLPKLMRDGGRLFALMSEEVELETKRRAAGQPPGTYVPACLSRGIQKRAIERFLAEQRQLGGSEQSRVRYAKRALADYQRSWSDGD